MPQNYIGIDLSKDRLDVFDPRAGRASAYPNSVAGILARFLPRAPRRTSSSLKRPRAVTRGLRDACSKAGRGFVRLNPLHAWHFAQSLNLPKTDRVDARMLARLGTERQPATAPSTRCEPGRRSYWLTGAISSAHETQAKATVSARRGAG